MNLLTLKSKTSKKHSSGGNLILLSIMIIISGIGFPMYAVESLSSGSSCPKISSDEPEFIPKYGIGDIQIKKRNIITKSDSEFKWIEVTTTKGGELASLIGNSKYFIDSISVKGPLNSTDFDVLWESSFEGRLTIINLSGTTIENGRIPDYAFMHPEAQCKDGVIRVPCLTKIILPEGVNRFGSFAFNFVIDLETVEFSEPILEIGEECFCECRSLKANKLTFAEGLTEIGLGAFSYCRNINAEVSLPSTIQNIKCAAFYSCKITSINLPEGLEIIEPIAFYGTLLKTLYIPDSCSFIVESAFHACYNLLKLHLPTNLTSIPLSLCNSCIKLKEVNIPASVTIIPERAFELCLELSMIELPPKLEEIGENSFFSLENVKELKFPATMKYLGSGSCNGMRNLDRIYCVAITPPVCMENESAPGMGPFGRKNNADPTYSTPIDCPVYVPVGSAEAYRNAFGWDYFTNFIETDDFPTTGIYSFATSVEGTDSPTYDVFGNKVTKMREGQIYIKDGKKFIYHTH